ncbi:Protein nud1 [Sporothrix stenoceras]|uniref:Protein nud1 n=1 Tax=Sporothrix stenoceras TaxID=5173 RepID=A0ABR3Z403_9PEZI
MANAWLDSLSEDWVSQAGSEPSHSPTHTTKFTNTTKTNSTTRTSRGSSGRLFGSVRNNASDHSPANSSGVLSERSANDINIFGSNRRPSPSKLSNEYKIQDVKELQSRGRPTHQSQRSVSASSLGSVIHNTIDHKPHSVSPGKGGDTPEWRRRLVQGDLAYGEQRDLFTSAKTGLENMFNPPGSTTPDDVSVVGEDAEEDDGGYEPHNYNQHQSHQDAHEFNEEQEDEHANFQQEERIAHDMTMPSSPPVRSVQYDSSANYDESAAPQLPEQPRGHSLDPVAEESAAYEEEEQSVEQNEEDEEEEEEGSVRRHFQDTQNDDEAESMPPSDGSQISYPVAESRVVSGQSVLRNESFSAIMISPEKNKDGAVFAPVELPSGELKRRLENLRWNQMVLADDVDQDAGKRVVSIGGKSLNVDNTEEYDKMGGFINFRRGGRSADGSFRDRMLSPPIGNDTSEMLPEESLQASTPKQFASVRIEISTVNSNGNKPTPQIPRAPNPSPEKRGSLGRQQQQQPGGGSPLKLFGPYDTFTNQTLMRRISQFEDQMSNGSRNSADRSANLSMDGPEMAKAFVANLQKSESRQSSAQFGSGELDDFQFGDEDASRLPQEQIVDEDTRAKHEMSKPDVSYLDDVFSSMPTGRKQGELHIQRMRQSRNAMSSRPSTAEKWVEPVDPAASAGKIPVLATPRRIAEIGSEGKRPRTSPSKDPTPKRRRTLHKSDVAFGVEAAQASQMQFDSVHASHTMMQSVIGRKRRDARDGNEFQYADAETLASRDILRPRTPTPSQRSSVLREQNPNLSPDNNAYDRTYDQTYDRAYDRSHNTRQNENENDIYGDENNARGSSAAWSDNSVSGPHMPAEGASVADGERKPSIRTEDFMNEAHKIMDMLRNRGGAGAQGGLASVEESEMETPVAVSPSGEEEDEVSFQESTKEPFSRPPSREGKPVPRAARMQVDPEVVAQLKKYEERSDLDGIAASTARSIKIAQNAIREEKEVARAVKDSLAFRSRTRLDESDDISDPPNIRISMSHRHASGSGIHDENPSQSSQKSASSGHSTVSSIPTGSSRGSDTRKTIAPQTVSHLIPDQVGNMMLDRDRNIWIKRRNGSSGSGGSVQNTHNMQSMQSTIPSLNAAPSMHNILPSEGSEEDPFADIPDLSVDATMEMHNLKPAVASPMKSTGPVLFTKSNLPMPSASAAVPNRPNPPQLNQSPVPPSETDDTVVEHEISIDEGRLAPSLSMSSSPSRSKRHLAISFSSPIASIIQDFVVEGDSESRMDRSPNESLQDAAAVSVRRGRRTVSVKFKSTATANSDHGSNNSGSLRSRSRSASRGPARKLSVAGQAFVPRPVSRIDEEDDTNHSRGSATSRNRELSIVGERSELVHDSADEDEDDRQHGDDFSELISQRQASVSVLVTTPGPAPRADDEQIMAQYVGMLSLSPMSEFTIHQDRSLALEASYVMGDRHLVTGDNSKAVMAQSLRDLVAGLTEVEPFEPYWEDMEELDVHGKKLESLHKLDEFCPQLVTLDAAGNALRNLSGVPLSVRHLRVVDNQLSELTMWTSLANLQYLDISGNDIKTLSGLKNLVHLRGLKADNCGLENLDGLKYHDALQTLRARGNQLKAIDFDGTRLHKLVELDLENNQIASASGLDQLVSLATLNLRRNELVEFTPAIYGSTGLPHVRTLNVSDNQLAALDVRGLPSLRVLFADRNRLARVRGFSKTPRLDSVSLREQQLNSSEDDKETLDISSLYHAYEIRKLYLSGNRLESFDPPVDFLNLQLLELANCGLTSLPLHLGRAIPNLRKVNLNFNALADLSPLSGISRLKKVLAVGNRLAKAYAVIQTLATFVHLTEVDLRDNPVTQGFYPHVTVSTTVANNKQTVAVDAVAPPPEPFTLPSADIDHDKAYCSRLDLATGMRRRVYSQVLGDACTTLKVLDGLAVDRGLADVRDAVWQALNTKGIISKETNTGSGKKTASKTAKGSVKEVKDGSRWGAEDSFA